MAGMLGMMATLLVLVPLIPLLWILVLVMLLLGIAQGTVDLGGNVFLVWVHKHKVGAFINGLHFFFGEEGTIFASDRNWVHLPRGSQAQREEHSAPADLGTLHMADFLDAVRQRRPPCCQVEDAFRSTATVQLAMIAYETNSIVQWEESTEQIVNNPAAAALLQRDYRPPWVHPYRG